MWKLIFAIGMLSLFFINNHIMDIAGIEISVGRGAKGKIPSMTNGIIDVTGEENLQMVYHIAWYLNYVLFVVMVAMFVREARE